MDVRHLGKICRGVGLGAHHALIQWGDTRSIALWLVEGPAGQFVYQMGVWLHLILLMQPEVVQVWHLVVWAAAQILHMGVSWQVFFAMAEALVIVVLGSVGGGGAGKFEVAVAVKEIDHLSSEHNSFSWKGNNSRSRGFLSDDLGVGEPVRRMAQGEASAKLDLLSHFC